MLLFGFLFGSHTRSLPPVGHSECLGHPPINAQAGEEDIGVEEKPVRGGGLPGRGEEWRGVTAG